MDDKEFLRDILKKAAFTDKKIDLILSNIKDLNFSSFKNFDFEDEKKRALKLNGKQKERLKNIQKDIVISPDLRETMVKFRASRFVRMQYKNLDSLKLEDLNVNPFTVKLIKLQTPKEVVDWFARSNISISIATSLGFTLEHFLIDGHQNVKKLKKGFDAAKTEPDTEYELEFKSGPNDVNKTAMRQYNTDFKKKEEQNIKPILGMLYGRREKSMALTHAENELDKPDEWVMVGHEIWDFVSGEKGYSDKVMKWILKVVSTLDFDMTIPAKINSVVSKLVRQFEEEYGKGEAGVQKYISQSM